MTATCSYNNFVHFVPSLQSEQILAECATDCQDNKDDRLVFRAPASQVALSELFSRLPRSPFPNYGTGIADSTLLAHYCQRTSRTLGGAAKSDTRAEVWRQGIPYVAYRHQCVLHAIAAIAAMHVWCERIRQPPQFILGSQYIETSFHVAPRNDSELLTRRYLHQATIHHGHCLRWFQQELRSVTEQNVDAVLACSALLAPFGLAYYQVERRRIQNRQIEVHAAPGKSQGLLEQDEQCRCGRQRGNVTIDLGWFNLLRGIQPCLRAINIQGVCDSAILPLFQWSEDEQHITLQSQVLGQATSIINDKPTVPRQPLLPIILAEGNAALTSLHKQLESIRMQREAFSAGQQFSLSSNLEACLEAAKTLRIVARQVFMVKASNHRFLMSWISRLDNTFVNLLVENDILALAVYAHFLVYATLLQYLWWVGDLGVDTLRNILEGLSIVGCRRCLSEDHQGRPVTKDGTDAVSGLFDGRGLFAWPARILELHERLNQSYVNTGVQNEGCLSMS